LWALKKYLKSNPQKQAGIMDYNERYVFFEIVSEGPLGSLGVRLTPGRSIAMDADFYPKGALAYIETEVPVIGEDGQPVAWKRCVGSFLSRMRGGPSRERIGGTSSGEAKRGPACRPAG
jgi:membrane-bound lytic murein transglycosylase A